MCRLASSCLCCPVCEVKLLTGVGLKLLGRAKVYWSESSGTGDNRSITSYSAEETYIDEKVYVYGSRESIFSVIFKQHLVTYNAFYGMVRSYPCFRQGM